MLWKLWKMGEEPPAPSALRSSDAWCGAVTIRWDASEIKPNPPVHKFVLRRAVLGQRGGGAKDWVTVMDGASTTTAFLDAGLQPGESYRFNLQAWNAIGHSNPVEIDVTVATKGCKPWSSWWGVGSDREGGEGEEQSWGDLFAALIALAATVVGFRTLGGRNRRGEAAALAAAAPQTRGENGNRRGGEGDGGRRERPDFLLPPAALLSSHSEGDGEGHHAGAPGGGSPVSASSNGGGNWSDREKNDLRKKNSMLRIARGHKMRLKRASSEVTQTSPITEWGAGGGAAPGGRSSPLVNGSFRQPGTPDDKHVVVESMRREAARRLMPRRSSSREDKEICRVCRREWKW